MPKPIEKQETRYCLECGREIKSGANGRRLYCSDKCKMRAWRREQEQQQGKR